jgi:hypothetical protein
MSWVGWTAMGLCGFFILSYASLVIAIMVDAGDMPHDGSAWTPWENKNGETLWFGKGIDPNKPDGERWKERRGFGFGGL